MNINEPKKVIFEENDLGLKIKENFAPRNFIIEEVDKSYAKIKVVGVGGAGCNAVSSLLSMGLEGVDFYAINTDIQALKGSDVKNKLQIGQNITYGLGTGGDPCVGEKAALESKDAIQELLSGSDMVFITAGLGGGTGTGASPIISQIAKEMGILTVTIVTKPFVFEGPIRMRQAIWGIDRLREFVDTLIVISNEKLLEITGPKATLLEAFNIVNDVLYQGVRSISDLITVPGLMNVDFADIKMIMGEKGGAVMGVGIGKGEGRAVEALKKACASPLLDKIVIEGAKGILINVTGGKDITLREVSDAIKVIYESAAPDANIKWGVVIDESMKDELNITIIATGFEDEENEKKSEKENENQVKLTNPSGMTLRTKLESLMSQEVLKRPGEKKNQDIQTDKILNKEGENPSGSYLSKMRDEKVEKGNLSEVNNPIEKELFAELDTDDDLEKPAFLRRRKTLFQIEQ